MLGKNNYFGRADRRCGKIKNIAKPGQLGLGLAWLNCKKFLELSCLLGIWFIHPNPTSKSSEKMAEISKNISKISPNIQKVLELLLKSCSCQKLWDKSSKSNCWFLNLMGKRCPGAATISIPFSHLIMKRRILFFHYILNEDKSSMLYIFVIAQKRSQKKIIGYLEYRMI